MPARGGERLRVGLDLTPVGSEAGGIARYAAELVPELLRREPCIEITAFATRRLPHLLTNAPWADSVRWIRGPIAGGPLHVLYQQLGVPLRRAVRSLDLVHGIGNSVPLLTPTARRVMTLHDVVWMHHPDVAASAPRRLAMHGLAMTGARRAHRVLTDSAASRADLVETASLDPKRIDVAPLGVRLVPSARATPPAELRTRLRLGRRRVVLCVSQMRTHKNLPRLLRAVGRLSRDDFCLVLAGEATAHQAELQRVAGEARLDRRLRILGWVPEADLEGLYRAADCLVLPSLREGFGLPLLEAMARGVPVASSDIPVLREVGGDAVLRFAPSSEAGMAAAIERLLDDGALADRLRRRGHERCRRFPWRRTAAATLRTYRLALDAPEPGGYARPRATVPVRGDREHSALA